MNVQKMPPLKIGNFTIPVPVVQGGMGIGVSLSGLASAVANAGGVGVISSVGVSLAQGKLAGPYARQNREAFVDEIRKARALSKGFLGVNVMVALTDFEEMVKLAIDEAVDIVFVSAGLPLKLKKVITADLMKSMKTKVVPVVSSARATKVIFDFWLKSFQTLPEAVVVEGPMAGGHLGFKLDQIDDPDYFLEKIVPEVVAEVAEFEAKFDKTIPVIAGGGIFSGEDIKRIMSLGAKGVQMGTRFVATDECDADIKFKEAYVNCNKEDVTIINSPVGLPGRAIKGSFIDEAAAGNRHPESCPWKCLKTCDYRKSPYCIAGALTEAQGGRLEDGFAFAGANVWKVDRIVSVQKLIDTLQEEWAEAEI